MRFALIFGSSLLAFSLVACQQNPEKAEKKRRLPFAKTLPLWAMPSKMYKP